MEIDPEKLTAILVDKWYTIKPGSAKWHYHDPNGVITFYYDNEYYYFYVSEIKGFKYGS